jgi:hypothetical protein
MLAAGMRLEMQGKPPSRAISSTGTPELDISETNECRNSRGVQFPPIFAALQAARNSRRTLAASRGAGGRRSQGCGGDEVGADVLVAQRPVGVDRDLSADAW